MTPDSVLDIGQRALEVTTVLGSVVLLPALVAGLLVAMFQAATQINEMTLSFIPKLFIVATVPDHFLEEHLWKHVAREHALRVFLWTLGAMLVLFFVFQNVDVEHVVHDQRLVWILLAAACLIGLIPQSGPHLVFVLLFIDGLIPFSILLANAIAHSGHAPLPLLAHSRRAFLGVKGITFVVGAVVGAVLLALGW